MLRGAFRGKTILRLAQVLAFTVTALSWICPAGSYAQQLVGPCNWSGSTNVRRTKLVSMKSQVARYFRSDLSGRSSQALVIFGRSKNKARTYV